MVTLHDFQIFKRKKSKAPRERNIRWPCCSRRICMWDYIECWKAAPVIFQSEKVVFRYLQSQAARRVFLISSHSCTTFSASKSQLLTFTGPYLKNRLLSYPSAFLIPARGQRDHKFSLNELWWPIIIQQPRPITLLPVTMTLSQISHNIWGIQTPVCISPHWKRPSSSKKDINTYMTKPR